MWTSRFDYRIDSPEKRGQACCVSVMLSGDPFLEFEVWSSRVNELNIQAA